MGQFFLWLMNNHEKTKIYLSEGSVCSGIIKPPEDKWSILLPRRGGQYAPESDLSKMKKGFNLLIIYHFKSPNEQGISSVLTYLHCITGF